MPPWILALPLVVAAGAETVELPSNLRRVGVEASSTLRGRTADAFAAWKVLDGDAGTAWCEGKGDAGSGEAVTLTFAAPVTVDEIAIVTGLQATPALFEANNVPSTVEVRTDDGRTVEAMDASLLEGAFDYTGTASVELGGPPVRRITLRIGAVEKVTAANHTCIADVRIRSGSDDLEPVLGVDGAGLRALPDALRSLLAAVSSCDRVAIGGHARFPLPFDFLQVVPPSPANGFTRGARPVRYTFPSAADLAARCAARDPASPSAGETEIDGLVYTARSVGPGELSVRVETRHGQQDRWRVAWKDGRWTLTGISRIPE